MGEEALEQIQDDLDVNSEAETELEHQDDAGAADNDFVDGELEFVEEESQASGSNRKSSLKHDMHKYRLQRNEERRANAELKEQLGQLQAQIAVLSGAKKVDIQPQSPPQQQMPVMPDRYDYDDDQAYQDAVNAYNADIQNVIDESVKNQLSSFQEEQKKQDSMRRLSGSLDSFYETAEQLRVPDMALAINNVVDEIGEESLSAIASNQHIQNHAMLIYSLGKSEAKRSEFKRLLDSDPVGATIWLAKQDDKMPSMFRQKRNRPEPDSLPENTSGGGKMDYQKEAEKALDSGDPQRYAKVLKQAKAAGVAIEVKD